MFTKAPALNELQNPGEMSQWEKELSDAQSALHSLCFFEASQSSPPRPMLERSETL